MTCYDLFSRWSIAIPLRTKTAEEVGRALYNEVLCRYGPPEDNFLSDLGREFVNAGFAFITKMWGIRHTTTGGYQPQALPTERWHRWLNHMMTALSARFGLAWTTYLQTVVYCYNVSTCASTGYSPYELMFGRVGPYLQDLVFTRKESQRTANTVDWGSDLVAYSTAIYKMVRENQAKMANANQARNNKKRNPVLFTPEDKENGIAGDSVLLWEPQQTKWLHDTSTSVLDASKAPQKWTPKWTGPHTVIEKIGENHYRIFHKGRAIRIKSHVNRLVRFYPWSDTVTSTSDWENIYAYQSGEWANEGAMIIVPLMKPYPFGVAKILKTGKDGAIQYQWWGNDTNNVTKAFMPGWISKIGSDGDPWIYYQMDKKEPNHAPYIGHEDLPMKQKDIVVHSFELARSGKLPMVVLKAIDEDYCIWWTRLKLSAIVSKGARATNNTPHEHAREAGHEEEKDRASGTRTANNTPHEHEDVDREGGGRHKKDPREPDDVRRRNKRPRTLVPYEHAGQEEAKKQKIDNAKEWSDRRNRPGNRTTGYKSLPEAAYREDWNNKEPKAILGVRTTRRKEEQGEGKHDFYNQGNDAIRKTDRKNDHQAWMAMYG